jgi:hypothetical protein
MLINIIAGARPYFIKVEPITRALEARTAAGGSPRYRLVHKGGKRSSWLLVSHSPIGTSVAAARLAPWIHVALEKLLASPVSSQS